MKILISNDDGYFSPGINALIKALEGLCEVVVVAPETNHSGTSSALTLNRPLCVRKLHDNYFIVNGTPADCIHIALTHLLDYKPDLVLSGINNGANMGEDVIYSGTVAAAREANIFNISSMAFSLVEKGWKHIDSAAIIVREIVEKQMKYKILEPYLLNINIPNCAYKNITSILSTRLGKRFKAEPPLKIKTPYGEEVYWIGKSGLPDDISIGTDFHAISNNSVSITPLIQDFTKHDQVVNINYWIHK
ncbi:5'-nucleotidase SurE [Candidatus Kinetoplastibacterium sorsogonicusi]|uniref:5'-nucleotidase SurE n=1 Tax=Candidatus Kinetoplastidibacterium kentomonadis TaxID=1576550 RepID=A0A3Q8EU63_9PROT|nr:5'/3'-nucleotidase SurE [Candidatus Kinetoplastibacterium sorsogonicusi]AWD32375.1 5'-nucleotidase SurE [Candidatus Kinetoplastibacterium sorsogonicusi]